MRKIMKYFSAREKAMISVSLMFIFFQVWLDLKLPDYMSEITTLVETEGSDMADILAQGEYMLACAIGSMIASIIVGYYAAVVAAGLAKTLRGLVFDKTMSFSMAEINEGKYTSRNFCSERSIGAALMPPCGSPPAIKCFAQARTRSGSTPLSP